MAIYVDMSEAQFENVNELRSYPFSDGCSMVDRNGRELPMDVVADVHLVVPVKDESDIPVVRMTSVHMSDSMVSVCFRSDAPRSGSGAPIALSVTVSADEFRPYFPYRLEKLIGSNDVGGVVTFGNGAIGGAPYTYFLENAIVHPCCVASARPPALRKFVDPRSGESVSGDASILFPRYISAERNGKSFRLSLAEGAADALMSDCFAASENGDGSCGATPISSINGVRPDADGNIVLWFH